MNSSDVLAVARTQIGYVERPDNITKYWEELHQAFQGSPWCAVFVSWCFKRGGAPLPAMGQPYGFSYVPDATNYFRRVSRLFNAPQPGDIALYTFGNGHTGIVESVDWQYGTITCIEGNTSPGTAGSQTNGGGVYRRTRPISQVAFGRPAYSQGDAVDMATPAEIIGPINLSADDREKSIKLHAEQVREQVIAEIRKVQIAGIDYDLLASKVADKLAARLAS